MRADCGLNDDDAEAKSNASEDEGAEANDEEESRIETLNNTFKILSTDAPCLHDDHEFEYTIFDDPKKEFAFGAKFDLELKKKEQEGARKWGKIDEVYVRAKLQTYIEANPEVYF